MSKKKKSLPVQYYLNRGVNNLDGVRFESGQIVGHQQLIDAFGKQVVNHWLKTKTIQVVANE